MGMMFDQNNTTGDLTPEEALAAVCGEGKKYASPAELAKAYLHADTHISVLEAEAADLRKKADTSTEVQELLKAIREGKQVQQQPPAQDQSREQQAPDLDKLLEEKLNSRLNAQAQESNQSKVIGHFKESYGNRANDMFDKLAKELEMDRAQLEQMCAERPAAVIKLANTFIGGSQPGMASLAGDFGKGGAPGTGGIPTTKSELIKKADAEKWPRAKKYEALNREMSRAAKEGRLDAWNR